MNKDESMEEKYVIHILFNFSFYIKRNMRHGSAQTTFFVKDIYFLVHNLFVH